VTPAKQRHALRLWASQLPHSRNQGRADGRMNWANELDGQYVAFFDTELAEKDRQRLAAMHGTVL